MAETLTMESCSCSFSPWHSTQWKDNFLAWTQKPSTRDWDHMAGLGSREVEKWVSCLYVAQYSGQGSSWSPEKQQEIGWDHGPDPIQEGVGWVRQRKIPISWSSSWNPGWGYKNVPVLNLICLSPSVRFHLLGQGKLQALRAHLTISDAGSVHETYSSLQQTLGQRC